MKKAYNIILIILFIIPLITFSFISILDKDKTISESEKRTLKQMPELNAHSYFFGQFAVDFEEYYSDTFPFRDFFMNISQGINGLKGFVSPDGVELIVRPGGGDLGQGENDLPVMLPDPDTEFTFPPSPELTTPGSTINPSGSVTPFPSGKKTSSPSALPTPSLPQTNAPATQPPVSNPGGVQEYTSIIIYGDRAMELYYYRESRLQYYIDMVNKLQSRLGSGVQVYSLIAPTSIEFYSPPKYHSLSQSQKNAISYIYSKLNKTVKPVDAYSAISPKTNEYLYFRTDHHWTSRGAYYAYTAFAKTAGFEPVPMNKFERKQIDGFVGSFYNISQSRKLKDNPDYVELFMPFTQHTGQIYRDTRMVSPYPIQAVRTNVSSSNKYLAFIGGDQPLTVFKTNVKNGKKILVTKESYGNAFIPFLLPHYEEIYVVDPRQIDMDICKFIKDKGIQEVIVLDYTVAAGNVKYLSHIDNMIK